MDAATIAFTMLTIGPSSQPPLPPPTDEYMMERIEPDQVICSSEDTVVIDVDIDYSAKATIYPEGDHRLINAMAILVPHTAAGRMRWVMDDGQLSALQPPPSPPGALSAKEKSECHRTTELLGKYLIERGFPLIGKGRYTLAFLITETKVAKVARYCKSVNPAQYENHRRERNLDVKHYQNHPAAFACTTYHLVGLEPNLARNTKWSWCAWLHELYVQELVKPLARAPNFHARSFQETYGNWRRVLEMLNANSNTPFNQWGLTDSKMLVCYDYQ